MKKIDFKEMNERERQEYLINRMRIWQDCMIDCIESGDKDIAHLWFDDIYLYSTILKNMRMMHGQPYLRLEYMLNHKAFI